MSYILEALQRADAERERARGTAPGLHAHTLPLASTAATDDHRLRWGVATLVAAGLLLAGWWTWKREPAPRPASAETTLAAIPRVPEAPPVHAAPVTTLPAQAAAGTAKPAAPPAPARQPAGSDHLPSLQELPDDLRHALPPLNVQGSIYSSQPGERLLILNTQPLREGDSLAPDLVLERIDARMAVLRFRGRRFGIPLP